MKNSLGVFLTNITIPLASFAKKVSKVIYGNCMNRPIQAFTQKCLYLPFSLKAGYTAPNIVSNAGSHHKP
jgi:hypothetical protein